MSDIPTWLGSIPSWLTAGTAVAALRFFLKFITERRIQDGARLTDLETENRRLRKDFDEVRAKFITENDSLRELIDGLRRQMLHLQTEGVKAMPLGIAPTAQEKFSISS